MVAGEQSRVALVARADRLEGALADLERARSDDRAAAAHERAALQTHALQIEDRAAREIDRAREELKAIRKELAVAQKDQQAGRKELQLTQQARLAAERRAASADARASTPARRSRVPVQGSSTPRKRAANPSGAASVTPAWVCATCLKDPYLHHVAAASQAKHPCLGCGRVRKGMLLGELTTRVEDMMSAYYHPSPSEPEGLEYFAFREQGYWEPPGEQLLDLLVDELDTTPKVAEAVCEELTEREGGHYHVASGGELYYLPEQFFVLSALFPDVRRHEAFRAFEHRLRFEARLFHPESRTMLASIFDKVDQLITDKGARVVVDVHPGTPRARLHRARVFQSDEGLEKALIAPDRELGSPPAAVARAGRMNVANVSVFYGASTLQTALAEVRPPAHSRVLAGEFGLLRPVRLLDVSALKAVLVHGSKFDPAHQVLGRHAQLLQTVSSRMSEPVLPEHQDGSYLLTQAIADYLAYECSPAFDGMIYPSTQTIDGGENVVLFHAAARCEVPDPAPGVTVRAELETDTADGPEPDYVVWLVVNDPQRVVPPAAPPATPDNRAVSLRLRRDSLAVHYVRPAAVATDDYLVRWHDYDASQPSDF